MHRPLTRIAGLLVVSAALGAGSAYWQDFPLTVDAAAVRARVAEERRKQTEIEERGLRQTAGLTLAELRDAIAGGALIIDARSPSDFEQAHLAVAYEPPVLNIFPEDGVQQHLERLYQAAGLPVVIYCNSLTCDLAEELYLALDDLGVLGQFAGVRIFFPGWEALEQTDLPRVAGPDTWTGFGLGDEGLAGDEFGAYPDEDGDAYGDTESDEP